MGEEAPVSRYGTAAADQDLQKSWVGIIVSAAIFSAMHMQFYGFLPRFALGVLLGLIYWYSGSLWVAILAHFIYDAVLIVLAYFYPEMLDDENTMQFSTWPWEGLSAFRWLFC